MKIKCNEILMIVYPYGYFGDYYTPFYDDFIGNYLLKHLKNTQIYLATSMRTPLKVVEDKFGKDCKVLNLAGKPDYINIWIRDWAPIKAGTEENPLMLKTKYSPRYLTKIESANAGICDLAGMQAARKIGNPASVARLILDGGGFVHDGNGTGIITNRVISDNESLSIEEIKKLFLEKFGISRLVIIPVEPGDETGHADGVLRFVGEKTLIVGNYPSKYREGKEYCDKLRSQLKTELPEFRIISLMNEVPEDTCSKSTVPSATGNHVNFLLAENKLFMPDYGLETDDVAYETLNNNLENIEIIRVRSKYLSRISKDGGVLNCISWQANKASN